MTKKAYLIKGIGIVVGMIAGPKQHLRWWFNGRFVIQFVCYFAKKERRIKNFSNTISKHLQKVAQHYFVCPLSHTCAVVAPIYTQN